MRGPLRNLPAAVEFPCLSGTKTLGFRVQGLAPKLKGSCLFMFFCFMGSFPTACIARTPYQEEPKGCKV